MCSMHKCITKMQVAIGWSFARKALMASGTGGERNQVMLTKRFVALLVVTVVSAIGMLSCTQENAENKPPPGSIPLQGAGATFPAPLYKRWIEMYQKSHPTNPGLNLPSEDIAVVARSDSSGTTFAFTNHLSAISAVWRDQGPGAVRMADWPGGTMLAPGNEGVAGRIQQSTGAIGYVQYGIAQRAGLAMAWLENQAAQFIQPHGGSGLPL